MDEIHAGLDELDSGRVVADGVIPYRVRAERLEIIAVFHGRQRWPRRL